MKYQKFKEIIQLQIAHRKKVHTLYDLKVDLLESFDEQEKVIEMLWQSVLTEHGYDWLSWYLYEKDGISGKPKKHLGAWDKDGSEICKDIKNLWEYLTKESYFNF